MYINVRKIPKGQSKMDNLQNLATQGTQDENKTAKTQRNMYWTPLHANKHK